MRDQELTLEVLRQIEAAAAKIIARFEAIRQVPDLVFYTCKEKIPQLRKTIGKMIEDLG